MDVVTRREYEELLEACPACAGVGGGHVHPSPEEAVAAAAQWLIERLYCPDPEVGRCVHEGHLARLGCGWEGDWRGLCRRLLREAVNWGDLRVVEVRRWGNGWLVRVEEADPDSPALAEYIEGWLNRWGWGPVKVEARW